MCLCGETGGGRGRIRGMVSVCHHYGTSDCQAVSHVSQAFCPPLSNLSLITLSSLSFSWQLSLHPLHVQAPSALPFLPIHSSVCFFLVSNSPLLLLHFSSHFSSFPLVIKCPAPPVRAQPHKSLQLFSCMLICTCSSSI